MKIERFYACFPSGKWIILNTMRIAFLLFFTVSFGFTPFNGLSQNAKVNLKTDKTLTVDEIFDLIEEQTSYRFVYPSSLIKDLPKVDVKEGTITVKDLLNNSLLNVPVDYEFRNKKNIVLSKAKNNAVSKTRIKEQQQTIAGIVTDEDGVPLPGVNITVEGTNKGTSTDFDGNYEIEAEEGQKLIFSSVGFEDQIIQVSGNTEISIQMQAGSALDEVVVVGYGTQKKRDLTAAISTIDATQIENKFFTNATEALRGAKGVYISQPGAQPGRGEATIRIRGQGTLNNNEPLILVDGIEYQLSKIDPDNISNISVLKDAAATAIYGSRAANGVVLITTKSGEGSNGFNISYNNYFGVSKAINLPNYVKNPIRYFELRNLAQVNAGESRVTYSDELIEEYRNGIGKDPILYPVTDWYKEGLRSALVQKHNVRAYGGGDDYNYSLALGYKDQDGVLRGTSSEKYSINLNTSVDITKKLKVTAIIDGELNKIDEPVGGADYLMDQVNREASVPYDPILTSDGRYADNWIKTPGHFSYRNPLALINEGLNKHHEESYRLSISGEYKLPENFSYKAQFGYTKENFLNRIFEPSISQYNVKTDEEEKIRITDNPLRHAENINVNNSQINFQHTLNWEKNLNKHNVFALLGNSLQIFNDNNFLAHREGYLGNELTTLNAGSTNPAVEGTYERRRLISVFGRLRYNFDGKYLFEANFRYDGSSRFAKGNRWGFFPSFSAGWQIGDEEFMSDVKWVNSLKLRASWGQIGNNRIEPYRYANLINLGYDYSFGAEEEAGGALSKYSDSDITWETTITTNVGIDAVLFNNSLDLSLEFYNKKTKDILNVVPLPAQVGSLEGPIRNIGTVSNRGIEVGINYNNTIGDFNYEIGGEFSTVRNRVEHLNGQTIYNSGWRGNGGTIIREGYPINSFYLLHATGIFQNQEEIDNHAFQSEDTKPGYVIFEDYNGDGRINQDDRVISRKSRIPKYTYSFNLGFGYKGLNLSAQFTGIGQAYSYSNYYGMVPFWYGSGVTEYWVKNSWTPDNPNAKFPILTTYEDAESTNFRDSDFLLNNVSYLRLKNVQLSYDLPSNVLKKLDINSVRIFISVDNLLTMTPLPYYDPEKNLGENTFNGYPVSRTWTIGLNIDL